jgi:hypothetical protein
MTRYLSALLGKLRRLSWPRENRLRQSRRSGREHREKSHSASRGAQEVVQRSLVAQDLR